MTITGTAPVLVNSTLLASVTYAVGESILQLENRLTDCIGHASQQRGVDEDRRSSGDCHFVGPPLSVPRLRVGK